MYSDLSKIHFCKRKCHLIAVLAQKRNLGEQQKLDISDVSVIFVTSIICDCITQIGKETRERKITMQNRRKKQEDFSHSHFKDENMWSHPGLIVFPGLFLLGLGMLGREPLLLDRHAQKIPVQETNLPMDGVMSI